MEVRGQIHTLVALPYEKGPPPLTHRKVRHNILGRFQGCSQNCEKRLLASSCPSVRVEHLGSHWTDFHEISYLRIFRKYVEIFEVLLKWDKNDR
jgi:hypothetical protein